MTLPQPVKPLPILFDIQDAPRWVHKIIYKRMEFG